MAFKDLYHACRERFLVSSDLALRTQLNEFFDHNMAKRKRGIDHTELIAVPIDAHVLEQFIEQQKDWLQRLLFKNENSSSVSNEIC